MLENEYTYEEEEGWNEYIIVHLIGDNMASSSSTGGGSSSWSWSIVASSSLRPSRHTRRDVQLAGRRIAE